MRGCNAQWVQSPCYAVYIGLCLFPRTLSNSGWMWTTRQLFFLSILVKFRQLLFFSSSHWAAGAGVWERAIALSLHFFHQCSQWSVVWRTEHTGQLAFCAITLDPILLLSRIAGIFSFHTLHCTHFYPSYLMIACYRLYKLDNAKAKKSSMLLCSITEPYPAFLPFCHYLWFAQCAHQVVQ